MWKDMLHTDALQHQAAAAGLCSLSLKPITVPEAAAEASHLMSLI